LSAADSVILRFLGILNPALSLIIMPGGNIMRSFEAGPVHLQRRVKNKETVMGFTLLSLILGVIAVYGQAPGALDASKPAPLLSNKVISEVDCTEEKLGTSIAVSAIGEPVSEVTLSKPEWHTPTGGPGRSGETYLQRGSQDMGGNAGAAPVPTIAQPSE
jgi:hypothetical protein